MGVIATSPIALRVPGTSAYPLSLEILVVLVLIAALAAAGYYIGRRYVNDRLNRRN